MVHFPDIKSFATLARVHARDRGDKAALIFHDRVTTYGQLDSYASQIANGLIGLGLKPQTRVGYLGKNSDVYFQILEGVAKANCVLVGINWRLAPPEVNYILNDAQATLLFVDEEFFPVVDRIRKELKTVKHVITLSGAREGWPAFTTWRDAQSDMDPMLPETPEDVALQMYTSGTTGNPKGVEMTNGGFFGNRTDAPAEGEWDEWWDTDVLLCAMPVFHIGGTGSAYLGLYAGITDVILDVADPAEIFRVIEQYKVTKMFMVPAALLMLTQHPAAKDTDVSTMRVIYYGASPITQKVLDDSMKLFFNAGFVQLYGMTETNGSATYLPPEDHKGERLKSCGKPGKNIEIKIVDDDGKELPPREVGEIIIRTPTIMKGYWQMPDATEKAVRDGWYYSGDAGYKDEDGYIYIHDRVKDMIVSGGENIYPAEIESALSLHPAVADVAVIGVPSDKWGEEVKALVVKRPDQDVTEEEIIRFARDKIAGFKVPKSVDFVAELPRNPSGKILKRELREPFWKGRERQVG